MIKHTTTLHQTSSQSCV